MFLMILGTKKLLHIATINAFGVFDYKQSHAAKSVLSVGTILKIIWLSLLWSYYMQINMQL